MSGRDLDELAKEKAEEIIYRQKIQELSSTVAEVIKIIPSALSDLRRAIELLEKECSTTKSELSGQLESKIFNKLLYVEENVIKLFKEFEKLEKEASKDSERYNNLISLLVDKNNKDSMIVQLEKLFRQNEINLVDLNNEKSLMFQIKNYFGQVFSKIDKNNNVRSIISWIISVGTGIATITLLLIRISNGG